MPLTTKRDVWWIVYNRSRRIGLAPYVWALQCGQLQLFDKSYRRWQKEQQRLHTVSDAKRRPSSPGLLQSVPRPPVLQPSVINDLAAPKGMRSSAVGRRTEIRFAVHPRAASDERHGDDGKRQIKSMVDMAPVSRFSCASTAVRPTCVIERHPSLKRSSANVTSGTLDLLPPTPPDDPAFGGVDPLGWGLVHYAVLTGSTDVLDHLEKLALQAFSIRALTYACESTIILICKYHPPTKDTLLCVQWLLKRDFSLIQLEDLDGANAVHHAAANDVLFLKCMAHCANSITHAERSHGMRRKTLPARSDCREMLNAALVKTDNQGKSSMVWAIEKGNNAVVLWLLKHCPSSVRLLQVKSKSGWAPIHYAAASSLGFAQKRITQECFKKLYHNTSASWALETSGARRLHAFSLGLLYGNRMVKEFFLGLFDPTDFQDYFEETARAAVSEGKVNVLQWLVGEGYVVSRKVWFEAVYSRQEDVVVFIARLQPSITRVVDSFGRNALHIAVLANDTHLFDLLVNEFELDTAQCSRIYYDPWPGVDPDELMEAYVYFRSRLYWSEQRWASPFEAMHSQAKERRPPDTAAVAPRLVRHPPPLMSPLAAKECTAQLMASYESWAEVFCVTPNLLRRSAPCMLAATPIVLAVLLKRDRIFEFLLPYERINAVCSPLQGWTLSHIVAQFGTVDMMRGLYTTGYDINAKDNQAQTPLTLCQKAPRSHRMLKFLKYTLFRPPVKGC